MPLLKYMSLTLLMTQSTVITILMRYLRTRSGDMFMFTTAVILQELCKTVISLLVILYQEGSIIEWVHHLYQNTIAKPRDCLKVSVPSLLYVMQNNLFYVGISKLDAATFQITCQLKILITAFLSTIMLRKEVKCMQWMALLLLCIGVCIVQLKPNGSSPEGLDREQQNAMVGLAAVITLCLVSGFAGVYFERILKGTPQTLWLRNVQLGVIGMGIGFITMELYDGEKVQAQGFFFGYDWPVFVAIGISALGGIIVAVVVKYADNILKGFATSLAIVLSCIASMYFFDFELSLEFTAGAVCVISSVFLYSLFDNGDGASKMQAPNVIVDSQNNNSPDEV